MCSTRLILRLLTAACSVAAVVAVTLVTSAYYYPLTDYKVDVVRGGSLFERNCRSCHSVHLEERSFGPNLAAIREVASTRRPGVSAHEYVFESIADPGVFLVSGFDAAMPASSANGMGDRDVRDVTAYLLQPSTRYEFKKIAGLVRRGHATTSVREVVDVRRAERGRELFFGRLACAQCHSTDATFGETFAAPTLDRIGSAGRGYIAASLIRPDEFIRTEYRRHLLVTTSGVTRTGVVLATSQEDLLLLEDTTSGARLETIPASDIEAQAPSRVSPMPQVASIVSPDELEDVIQFLLTLR